MWTEHSVGALAWTQGTGMRRSFSGKIRADRLESGGRLQKPEPLLEGATPLSFFTDAKAEAGRAWIGGFLELVEGCQGVWFSLEVEESWVLWEFAKGDPGKVISSRPWNCSLRWRESASGSRRLRRRPGWRSVATSTTSRTSLC